MPLKLNVGSSRKVGEPHYGSRGASVNLEIELDTALAGEPARLQERIRQLFALVRTSLAEELNGGQSVPSATTNGHLPTDTARAEGTGTAPPRMATQRQIRALGAIAARQRLNLAVFLRQRFQVSRAEELQLRQASQAIDELQGETAAGRD